MGPWTWELRSRAHARRPGLILTAYSAEPGTPPPTPCVYQPAGPPARHDAATTDPANVIRTAAIYSHPSGNAVDLVKL